MRVPPSAVKLDRWTCTVLPWNSTTGPLPRARKRSTLIWLCRHSLLPCHVTVYHSGGGKPA